MDDGVGDGAEAGDADMGLADPALRRAAEQQDGGVGRLSFGKQVEVAEDDLEGGAVAHRVGQAGVGAGAGGADEGLDAGRRRGRRGWSWTAGHACGSACWLDADPQFAIFAGLGIGVALLAFLILKFGGRARVPEALPPAPPLHHAGPLHPDATGESLAELTCAVHSLERTVQAIGESTELDIGELRDEVRALAKKLSEDVRDVHRRIDPKADDARLARLEHRVDAVVTA
ncbi:hypothetical protein HL658_35555 [Azospirillum sp. RWY-5-1]|uniref:DUF2746 domain-containing protein n=1 Tax=Azospirillum oleiclasticum TaxID=2735135 RepID=A0ABX2TLH4_9PROT|nr:hypothetical protein [Azospirillum oleiclasticum]NYZ17888.1 hypothetical protein [Azospirillum oleiclasticum]NYZ25096.1 hypothetical protein [Azospirillum oleiclasticum]